MPHATEAERVAHIEEICGHKFRNRNLVVAAITHPSAVEGKPVWTSYERLEFLGDSILGAIVATDLFEKFHEMDEGELTRLKISLVSGKTLSAVADKLGIGSCIVFGESEMGTGARGMHSALENVYESVETAHSPTFTSVVLVQGRRLGRGVGSSKKEAESAAAADAIERLAEEGIPCT